ncbi:TPA: hypothetical protein HA278_01075 [Candidatus Woesearchaeota archaeon]|nr:hypothetical protein [archaeon]HIJ10624.1 hypothetical protein [Candidatus Woesearchaeota archaeon]
MEYLVNMVADLYAQSVVAVAQERGTEREILIRRSIQPETTVADLNDAAVAYFKQEAEETAAMLCRGFSADSFYLAWNVTEPRAQLETLLAKNGWTLQEL